MADNEAGQATSEANQGSTENQEGKTPEQQKTAEAVAERKFKLKFGKSEKELTEKDLVALAQKGWASDEKFMTAAQERQKIQNFIKNLKEDPDALFKYAGVKDPVKFYRDRLEKEIKRRTMDPRERELEDKRDLLEKKERELKEREQNAHKERVQKLQSHYEKEYDKQMSDAIEKAGLPKNPRTVRRVAELAYKSLQQGGPELPWSTIVEIVKDEYNESIRELVGALGEDKVFDYFGEDIVKKVQTADMKRRLPGSQVKETKKEPQRTENTQDTSKMSPDEFREYVRNFGK